MKISNPKYSLQDVGLAHHVEPIPSPQEIEARIMDAVHKAVEKCLKPKILVSHRAVWVDFENKRFIPMPQNMIDYYTSLGILNYDKEN